MNIYKSPYEAYPFLSDEENDLRCDFEIITDNLSSHIGLLTSLSSDMKDELNKINNLVYHANASLRTFCSITDGEILWLKSTVDTLQEKTNGLCNTFVLPAGSTRGSLAHVLRTKCKEIVRLLYRHNYQGNSVDTKLFDFFNLLSGYFFMLALHFNNCDNFTEIDFISRNYK